LPDYNYDYTSFSNKNLFTLHFLIIRKKEHNNN